MAKFRQFSLLCWKDFVLMKRNKVWTVFEIILPLLITLPIVYIIVKNANTSISKEVIYESFELNGNASDVSVRYGFVKSIKDRWCHKSDVLLGYASASPIFAQEARDLMKKFEARFQSSDIRISIVESNGTDDLMKTLKDDLPDNSYCPLNKYVGGIVFESLSAKSRVLSYRVLIPRAQEEKWRMDQAWTDPYGANPTNTRRVPSEPPYWSSGFLTIQHAIETTFYETSTGSQSADSPLTLQGLPEPPYMITSIADFVAFLPFLWGICVFTTVLNIGREIASEKAAVKPFLSAMGLSSPMFYAAHIFTSWLKCLIIFFAVVIPLATVMKFVSPVLFVITVILYGLGAVVFGALIASMFESSNSALKAVIILWVVSLGIAFKFSPRADQISLCFAYSLNVNGAFSLAINAMYTYMRRERTLTVWNVFADSSINFSLGYALVMLVVDILWMSLFTLIIDHVLSSADFSIRSYFGVDKEDDYETQTDSATAANTRANEAVGSGDVLLEGSTEVDGAREQAQADIDVRRLVKVWSSTGERAVDGLSLRAVRGEVAVLLGHNGAGKSTTFSSIAGIIKPTSGRISICGYDVGTQIDACRQRIGLCPQYNPLYDKLTVEEHLWLVHGLKSAPRESFVNEMNRYLEDLKLDFKQNEMAMNLSGGMKRKLCVCMALIGDSEVVLLDEPTAGMDPGARKDVQALLEREKPNRTILLTTHYMDEAERLGDWVFIMTYGRLATSASSRHLKNKFGTGYLLTVVLDEKCGRKMVDVLIDICASFVPGAKKGEQHGLQVEVILPEKEKEHSFVRLFKALEDIQARQFHAPSMFNLSKDLRDQAQGLFVSNFGLSLNTLEQVFLRIGDLVEQSISRQASQVSRSHSGVSNLQINHTAFRTQSSTRSEDSISHLIESHSDGSEKRGIGRVVSQYAAIFRKRFTYARRNWPQLFGQVVLPLLLLSLIVMVSNITRSTSDIGRALSPLEFGPSKAVLVSPQQESAYEKNVDKIFTDSNFEILKYPAGRPLMNITKGLVGELPAAGLGALFNGSSVTGLFNIRAFHSLPTIVSILNTARFENASASISAAILTYSNYTGSEKVVSSTFIDMLLSPLLILVFAMLTSTFVMFLIEERVSQFAHQQFLTGISPLVFWSASLLFDFIFYALVCSVFLLMFLIYNWMTEHLGLVIILWLLYFFACVPFIYAVSFIFSSPSKANVLLIVWQVVASFAAMFFMLIVSTVLTIDVAIKETIRGALLFFLPSFSFGSALFTISTTGIFMTREQLLQWDELGKNFVFMITFSIFSCSIFLALQFKVVRMYLQQLWSPRRSLANNSVDQVGLPISKTVDREKELVTTGDTSNHTLVVKGLTKVFGKMTAVNELYLAEAQNEFFGLLGVNGAGKTTTFNILTGQSFATSGSATISGRNVTAHIPLGYCPQFDALMMDFTGRETLEILAQMHGYGDYKRRADIVLGCVGMDAHADKLVRYYSGGQKRKISVGVALMAPTKMIILDEPTAGIDPKARREIWELLLRVREKAHCAFLLTSHSMDECEALCSRIGVLNKGSLVALGTSQDLKSLYGNNYALTMTLLHEGERQAVCDAVAETFPDSILKTNIESKTLTLKWQLTKRQGDMWSEKFSSVQKLAKRLQVNDYCLAQSSLEDTFLRLAGLDEDDETDAPSKQATSPRRRQSPRDSA